MKDLFRDYLFTKHILVGNGGRSEEDIFNTLFALKNKFGINITKGADLADSAMIKYVQDQLGEYVPAPFYRNFPASVRELTSNQLLFDQLLHYAMTYGIDNFNAPGYSVFEEDFNRLAFNENVQPKDFEILHEDKATEILIQSVKDLLNSSRPLSEGNYEVVVAALKEYEIFPKEIPCKQTAVRLLYDTKNQYFARFLTLPDVIKLLDYINYTQYNNENMKKLNLKNRDRKIITKLIDTCFGDRIYKSFQKEMAECFEKRKIWCGLLHHIHYQPKCDDAKMFVIMIRSGENISVYSRFEDEMKNGNTIEAAKVLSEGKGSSVVIRNLNYLLSRCNTEEEVKGVLSWVK